MVKIIPIKNAIELEQAFAIRREVFVEEQQVDPSEEYEFEEESVHFLALDDNKPVGTARWRKTDNGIKLERFAVLASHRRSGVGRELLKAVLGDALKENPALLYLHAQIQVVPFYEKEGFVTTGGEFMEANIRHMKMIYKR